MTPPPSSLVLPLSQMKCEEPEKSVGVPRARESEEVPRSHESDEVLRAREYEHK